MQAPPSRPASPPGAIALFCAGLAAALLGAALPLVTGATQPAPEAGLACAHAGGASDCCNWLCATPGTPCTR